MDHRETPDSVAGVVLAAGGSRRWGGGSKLLASWNGQSLVASAVGGPRDAGLDPVLVVLGDRGDEVAEVLPPDVTTVRHTGWPAGRASSLAAGIRVLLDRPGVEAAAVFLGDEPRVPPSAVRAALDGWREGGTDAVRPFYRDVPGHPVVFGRRCFAHLADLDGEDGVRRYLEEGDVRVRSLHLDLPAPTDVDVREDLRRLRADTEPGEAAGE